MAAILDFRGVSDTKESQNPIFWIYFLDAFHHVRYQKSASIINFFHIWTPRPGLNEHEDFDQYGSFTKPSKMVPYYSHPGSLVNQNEISTELSY